MRPRTKIPLTLLAIAVVSLTAAACGLKGPLYRADEQQDESVAPVPDPANPAKKKDNASSAPSGEQSVPSGEPSVTPPDPDRPAVPPGR